MTTLLSNEIRKMPNQDEQKGSDLVVMERKGGKKSRFIEGMPLLSQRKSLEEGLQALTRVVEEKRQIAKADVAEVVSDTYVLAASIDNTFTDKYWILDSDCAESYMFLEEI